MGQLALKKVNVKKKKKKVGDSSWAKETKESYKPKITSELSANPWSNKKINYKQHFGDKQRNLEYSLDIREH